MGKLKIMYRIILQIVTSILFLIGMQSICFGQNTNDLFGKKHGYWDTCSSGLCYEAYYLNGMLNGVYKGYFQNKKLSVFGQYDKGKAVGIWYYFDESGHLLMEVSKIDHHKQTDNSNGSIVVYHAKAYFKFYYLNGLCKEEGFAIYEDPEIDIVKIGTWQHYDNGQH